MMRLLIKIFTIFSCIEYLNGLKSTSESLSLKQWSQSCNDCTQFFTSCFDCYGQRQCKNCLSDTNKNGCTKCADDIFSVADLEEINGQNYMICESNNVFHTKVCHIYCRGNYFTTGVCKRIMNIPVCECTDDSSSLPTTNRPFDLITTATTTTTQSSTTTVSLNGTTVPPKNFKGTLLKTLTPLASYVIPTKSNNFIAGYPNGYLRIINEHTGQVKDSVNAHHGYAINNLVDLQNGSFLSVSNLDYSVKLWDSNDLSLGVTVNQLHECTAIVELPEGDFACGLNGDTIKILDSNFKLKKIITGNQNQNAQITSLALTKNFFLVGGLADGRINFWSIIDGTFIKSIRPNAYRINKVITLPSRDIISVGSSNGSISFYDETGIIKSSIPLNDYVYDMVFFSSGHLVVLVQNGFKVFEYNDARLKINKLFDRFSGMAKVSSDLVAVGCTDLSIKIFNITNGELYKKMYGHTENIIQLTTLNNGDLVSISYDRTIKVWNIEDSSIKNSIKAHNLPISNIISLKDGGLLTHSINERTLKQWRVGQNILMEASSDERWGLSLTRLRNGDLAGCSTDNSITIWNLAGRNIKKKLEGHTSSVNAIIELNNEFLASGSSDQTIRIWDLSNDSAQILRGHTSNVFCLVQISNGLLASGSADTTIKIWNLTSGSLVKTLNGHTNSVNSLIVLPNGNLLSSSADSNLREWDVKDSWLFVKNIPSSTISLIKLLPSGNVISLAPSDIRIFE